MNDNIHLNEIQILYFYYPSNTYHVLNDII